MVSNGLTRDLMREVYDKAFFLLVTVKPFKKKQPEYARFNSKDSKLSMTYTVWDDLIDIFYNDKLVYHTNMYKRRLLTKDTGWLDKLREEYEKHFRLYKSKNQ